MDPLADLPQEVKAIIVTGPEFRQKRTTPSSGQQSPADKRGQQESRHKTIATAPDPQDFLQLLGLCESERPPSSCQQVVSPFSAVSEADSCHQSGGSQEEAEHRDSPPPSKKPTVPAPPSTPDAARPKANPPPDLPDDIAGLLNALIAGRFDFEHDILPVLESADCRAPDGAPYLVSPQVNPTLAPLLCQAARTADMQLAWPQAAVAASLCLCAQLMRRYLHTDVIGPLLDIVKLLGYAHWSLTQMRRDQIRSHMPPELEKLCSSAGKPTRLLFGDAFDSKAVGAMLERGSCALYQSAVAANAAACAAAAAGGHGDKAGAASDRERKWNARPSSL